MNKYFHEQLLLGCSNGLYSKPHPVVLPEGCPFFASTVAIALAPGCLAPHNALGHRIAVGRGPTQDHANRLALAEAAERYALQFSTGRDATLSPFLWRGGNASAMDQAQLTIGSPASNVVNSIGTAAGVTRVDAAQRAVLEYLERIHLDDFLAGRMPLSKAPAVDLEPVSDHSRWLEKHLRRLKVRIAWQKPGYWFALAACCDLDGGRWIQGSAAAMRRDDAVLAAVEEAIFHWRNMATIEGQGVDLTSIHGTDRVAFEMYRGARPREPWASPNAEARKAGPDIVDGVDTLLDRLCLVVQAQVQLFDLTLDPDGPPVVRVHVERKN